MVFVKRWQVIVTTTYNADQCGLLRIDLLQGFTMTDGDEPVAGAMQYIGVAFYSR
jgi:hypothetical protein